MGRKSTDKLRNNNQVKRNQWARVLYPFFRDHGLIGFSMEEVSDCLRVSKATIYNYFASKEEIIDCYLQEKFKDLDQFNDLISDSDIPTADRYEQSLYHLLKHFADFSPRVRRDLEYIFPDKWLQFNLVMDGFMARLTEIFRIGAEEGVFNAINPELLVICDRNMLFYLSDQEQVERSGLSLKQAFDEFMLMRQNGLIKQS